MNENLIINNNNSDNINEKQLFKDVKKMHYIKYLNLFFSIFRAVLVFYQIKYFTVLPLTDSFLFMLTIFIHFLLVLPIFTIINLIKTFSRIFTGNFRISKNVFDIFDCIGYNCCCNCDFNNVTDSKYSNLIYSLISLFLSFCFLYLFISELNCISNLSYTFKKKIFIKLILHFIDSIALLIQSYFYHYHDYFLRRGEIYIEFYKRLIIKNRKEEAEFVRNQLPRNIDDFGINSGQKKKDLAV